MIIRFIITLLQKKNMALMRLPGVASREAKVPGQGRGWS